MLHVLEKIKPFWNYAYSYGDKKKDGQKCHFTLKTYGGCKVTNFGTWKALKWKRRGLYANT